MLMGFSVVQDGATGGKGYRRELPTWQRPNVELCEFYLAFQVIRKVYLSTQRLKTYLTVGLFDLCH